MTYYARAHDKFEANLFKKVNGRLWQFCSNYRSALRWLQVHDADDDQVHSFFMAECTRYETLEELLAANILTPDNVTKLLLEEI